MALRFVQENIRDFGGNPNNVMIAGMSAGGASVHYMYLSELSRTLFRRGYAMSGSALCPWTLLEGALSKAKRVAENLGCPVDSSQKLVNCLKTKPARDIVILTRLFKPFHYLPFTVFGPVVEVDNPNAFLTKYPFDIILSGEFQDKPLILSVTAKEGLYPAGSYITNATIMDEINNRWNEIAPHLLDYYYTVRPEKRNEVSQKIRKFYYGDQQISVQNYEPLLKMVGDRLFILDVGITALLQSYKSFSPIYTYVFFYRGETGLSEEVTQTKHNYGASHGDDTGYGMSTTYIIPESCDRDREMMSRFVDMWTSFATTEL